MVYGLGILLLVAAAAMALYYAWPIALCIFIGALCLIEED